MKTLTQREAKEGGFVIDSSCSPNVAYKGPRFNPTEWCYVRSGDEETLLERIAELEEQIRLIRSKVYSATICHPQGVQYLLEEALAIIDIEVKK